MQPGYPVQQGYGQGYPPGYNPNPAYNPGYAPPMGGGNFGPGIPQGYGMPPQMPMQQQQVSQVRCKYCQGMMNANSTTCPNCGAHQ